MNCLIKKLRALNFLTQFVFDSKSWEQQTQQTRMILSCWGSSLRLKALHPCTYVLTLEVRENKLERKLSEVHLDPSDRSLFTVIIMYKAWIQYILNWYLGLEIKNSWVDNLTFQLFHHWNTSRKMIKSKYFISQSRKPQVI